MVEAKVKGEVERFALLDLEGWPAVVGDALEDEDNVQEQEQKQEQGEEEEGVKVIVEAEKFELL